MHERIEHLAEGVTLYLGDCLGVLPALQVDRRESAIVTDPPYGMDFKHSGCGRGGAPRLAKVLRNTEPVAGDDEPFDPAHLLALDVDAIMWGANHYADKLPASMGWLVWDKLEWTTPDTFSDCELAWHRDGTKVRKLPLMWKGVRVAAAARDECGGNATRFHPMQKPVALLRWCLSFVPDASMIIDPYMGSGSCGVAAVKESRHYIGIELKEHYFDIACRRISEALKQPDFFIERPKPIEQGALQL